MKIRIETSSQQDNQAAQRLLASCQTSRAREFHEVTILVDGEEVHKKVMSLIEFRSHNGHTMVWDAHGNGQYASEGKPTIELELEG